MKKIISFNKNIEFPTMIGEVTAIALDHNLKFIDESNITGNFKLTGRYKMTEASRLEEDFEHQIPVEILLTEKLDLETSKIDIEDFYYEIENDDTMICYIDVKVEGVEIIEETESPEETESREEMNLIEINNSSNNQDSHNELLNELERNTCLEPETDCPKKEQDTNNINYSNNIEELTRECDGEKNSEMENNDMSKMEEENTKQMELNENVGSLFSSFKDSDETFATYSVYILRHEETIETILEKYKITKEELEKYNDLTNLTIGTKIIIPTLND